jgi:Spy/CpxP family protein refolding chaperone
MNPRMIYWWAYARPTRRGGEWAGCETFVAAHGWSRDAARCMAMTGGRTAFGVHRPLRLLAYKLELDDEQVRELARILNELKTERAQAEVDERRTVAAFADALDAAAFDEEKAREGATLRVRSAERLREAAVKALRQLHALLDAGQRTKLAYLIRTGTIVL